MVDADGKAWACPMYVGDLGRVHPGRLKDRGAFQLGSWRDGAGGPGEEELATQRAAMAAEPVLGPKRERWSILGRCADCIFAEECTACPAGSHLPDVQKTAEEVPPLLCALNMAFLSRRERVRRPPVFADFLR